MVLTEKFNFNTFNMPLNFLSDIYNGKISLKEAEFKQRDLEKKIDNLKFGYKSKDKKEKEEKSQVLMDAKELLESRSEIIKAFKDDIFLSEHLKKSDDAAYDFTLKNVNKFVQEIRSMEEKINLSLFEELFESSSPADYAKMLINIKNQDENKERVEEIKNRILNLKKRMSDKAKKDKNVNETLQIIDKILDYNKDIQKIFQSTSTVDKRKSEPKIEKGIAERVKLKNNKIAEIKKEEKNINTFLLSTTLLIIKTQVICIKNYARQQIKQMNIKYIQSKKY